MMRGAITFCVLALGAGLFMAAPAKAVLVTTTINGSIELAHPTNPFGLTTADSVTAVAVYDDGSIPAVGAFNLGLDSDPSFSLTVTLGSFTFVETDDDEFGSGFPRLEFTDGDLVGMDFERDGFGFGGFADLRLGEFSNGTRWFLDDNVGPVAVLLEGTWDFANAVTVPNDVASIPEPSAWLLFAGGLFGLAGMTRQARKARPAA